MGQSKLPTTVEEFAAEQLRRQVERVAADLEHLAQRVRSAASGIDAIGRSGRRTYGQVATDVQHAVMSALPNLCLHNLTTTATEADVARAKGE